MTKRRKPRRRYGRKQARFRPRKLFPHHRGHIIGIYLTGDNEYALHATKGYRWCRMPPSHNAVLDMLMERLA